MKALFWGLGVAALFLSVVFGLDQYTPYTLHVEGPPASQVAAGDRPVCPPRTLPDEGACVPVPRPARTPDTVARLPGRPEAFDAYALPAPGRALAGTWDDLPLSERIATGDALVIASERDAPVTAVTLAGESPTLLAQGADWLLLAAAPDRGKGPLLALFAPLILETQLAAGSALAPGTALGKTLPGGFGIATRQLRPNQPLVANANVFADAHSVAVDPRNVLPLKTP